MTRRPDAPARVPHVDQDDHGHIDVEQARRLGALDSASLRRNAQIDERARMISAGEKLSTVEFDAVEDSDKYDNGIIAFRGSGDVVKVEVKRVLPSRDDVGSFPVHAIPDYGAFSDFIRRHAWNGQASEYIWALKRRGKIISRGDLKFDANPRVMAMSDRGEWPEPFPDSLRYGRPAVAAPAPAPPAQPVYAQPAPVYAPQPAWEPPPAPRRRDPREDRFDPRESEFERAARDYGERDDRDERDEPRRVERDEPRRRFAPPDDFSHRAPAPVIVTAPSAERNPLVDRLLDELNDMRQQANEDRRQFAELLAQARTQPEPRERDYEREREYERREPPAPAPQAAPQGQEAIAGLLSLSTALSAVKDTAAQLGMVNSSVVAELQRKNEADRLTDQINHLAAKLDELRAAPAAVAAAAAATATAAAAAAAAPGATPAAADAEDDDKEETPEEALAKRTTVAGPATIIKNEDGEVNFIETIAASIPGLAMLFKGMQDQKIETVKAETDAVRRHNAEMARQTKLLKNFADQQERLAALGIQLPDPPEEDPLPEEDAGSSGEEAVASDRPFAPTSLGDEEIAQANSLAIPLYRAPRGLLRRSSPAPLNEEGSRGAAFRLPFGGVASDPPIFHAARPPRSIARAPRTRGKLVRARPPAPAVELHEQRKTRQPEGEAGVQHTLDSVARAAIAGGEDARVRSHVTYVLKACDWPQGNRERAACLLADTRTLRHVPDPVNAEFVPEAHLMMPDHVAGTPAMFVAEDCDGLTVRWLAMCLAAGIRAKVVGYWYGADDDRHVAGAIWDDIDKVWLDGDPSLQNLPLGQSIAHTRRQERELPSMLITCDGTYCPINTPPVQASVDHYVSVGTPPPEGTVPDQVLRDLGAEMLMGATTLDAKWALLKTFYDHLRLHAASHGAATVPDLIPLGWSAEDQQTAIDSGAMVQIATAALRDAASGKRGVWPVKLPNGETTFAIERLPGDLLSIALADDGTVSLVKPDGSQAHASADNTIGNPAVIAAAAAVMVVAAAYAVTRVLDTLAATAKTVARSLLQSKIYDCQSAEPPCSQDELDRRLAEQHKFDIDIAQAEELAADANLALTEKQHPGPEAMVGKAVYVLGVLGDIFGGIQVIRTLAASAAKQRIT